MSRPQRAIILSELSEYRAPCTMIFEAALSMAWRSSDESSTATAPMFSSRRSGFRVPGMGTIHTFWASSKACAPGQAPRPTAVLASVVSGVMNATRTISVPAAATARERPGSGGSLRAQQRLDRAALVHRAVALRHLLQRQGQVEDLAGVDLPVPDQLDQLGQEAPHWGGTAVQVHMREEELLPRDLHIVEHADEPDVTAGPRAADGLHHRLLRADGLHDRVRAEPAGELLDPCRALLAALGHDLTRAELPGEPLAGLVPAHRDDPLRAELLGGEHREQADGTVANDRHRLAWSGLGRHSAKPAGAEHVGGREQAGDHVLRRQARRCYEGAVGERDAGVLCLCAGGGTGLPVDARRLVAGPADLAGVVGGEERADDELARLDQTYLAADLLDNADVFMAHWGRPVDRRDAAVGPEVRAAHAADRQSDEGVGRLDDRRVGALLETHVPGAVKNCYLHDLSPSEYRALGRIFDIRRHPARRDVHARCVHRNGVVPRCLSCLVRSQVSRRTKAEAPLEQSQDCS